MASVCRSAVTIGTKSFTARSSNIISKTLITPKPIPSSSPFSFSTRPAPFAARRMAPVLGSVESMMPLHSAIASARLKSNIAADSSCWSFLSQVPRRRLQAAGLSNQISLLLSGFSSNSSVSLPTLYYCLSFTVPA